MILQPKNVPRHLVLAGLLLTCIAGPVFSQIVSGMNETTDTGLGGNNFVTGTVYWPSGKPVNTRMGIRLTSVMGGETFASTDDRGQFVFSGVSDGGYYVVIDREKDFEPVSYKVDVMQKRSIPPQVYSVMIRLRDKAGTAIKPAVIDIENAGISKRALDLYGKAMESAKVKDYKGAIEQLRLAIVEYPKFMNAFNQLGVQYLELNELGKADDALKSALEIKSDAFEPLANRGIVLFRQKKYSDAEPVLRAALKVKESSPVAHYYLGRTLAGLERFDEAEKELNSAIAAGGAEMKEAHRMLATVFIAKGEDKRAVSELETYLTLYPAAPDASHLRQVISDLKRAPSPPTPKPL